MSYTKEEVIDKIEKSFFSLKEKTPKSDILINRLIESAGFKGEGKSEILELFGVNKYAELLQTLDQYEVYIPDGKKDKAVRKKQSEEQMCNTITKENKMAETTKHHDRIATLKNALSEGLYEKDAALRLALLAAIAGESIFFLGAPGCAKSMLARRIAQAFKADGDGSLQYFETLLNQFSTPEDVFGNISLKALNGELEDGKEEYRRLTENMLPEADIAFLDEIWKASPANLNTLLTIINERKFHNGSKVQDVPLKALLAASNELPAKNRGLEALYDRFIIRLPIGFIADENSFFDMVEGASSEFELSDEVKKLQISNEDLKNWKTQIDAVQLSEEARAVISAIRKELTAQNETLSEEEKATGESFAIGDRRWKKIVRILKTSAFLNDRTEVDLMDCQLIEYCIWSTEKQQKKAREIVEKCIQQNGLDCDTALEDINERIEDFGKTIMDNFYIKEEGCPAQYKMQDGYMAYKIVHPRTMRSNNNNIDPHYLCPQYRDGNYTGAYYDKNGSRIGGNNSHLSGNISSMLGVGYGYGYYFQNGSFKIQGNTAYWRDGYAGTPHSAEIELVPDRMVKNHTVFETPDLLELRRTQADSEQYLPIKNSIESGINKIDKIIQEKSQVYKANIFADTSYCNLIMTAVVEAKKTLQDAQVRLDKQRAQYR